MRLASALLCLAACASCSPVIPDKSIELTASQSISYASLLGLAAAAAATYYVVDPLAPNWEVVEAKVADNRWRLALRKKHFTTGGDGEAVMLLHRHAERLAESQGYRSYQILQWQEGIQSDMPLAHRWARGEVELRDYLPPIPEGELPGAPS